MTITMARRAFAALSLAALAACAPPALDPNEVPEPIGSFKMGHFAATTAGGLAVPEALSRTVPVEDVKAAMRTAFEPRLQRFTAGDEFWHVGVVVDGYVLARAGIPLVAAPKSALIFSVFLIEDATGERYPAEPHQITVIEEVTPGTFISSGLTRSPERQLEALANQASFATEKWLREQPIFYADGVVPEAVATPASETEDDPAPEVYDPPQEPLAIAPDLP
ncbi:MAG: hypothetical protein ACU0DW_12920 [Shimia sp.]